MKIQGRKWKTCTSLFEELAEIQSGLLTLISNICSLLTQLQHCLHYPIHRDVPALHLNDSSEPVLI